MSFNLTAGNPRAHRIRVYFENSGSATIYEGMPLCYNYDTDTNWFGGSMTNGAVSATTTTADGSQNEGRYIRVELPANNNLMSFAGVVAAGGWCGKADARVLDIYVPNGAIVPVRCDVDTTEGVTILAITVGEDDLGQPVSGTSRPVAIAVETETGLSTTPDITLAKLDPNMFSYQNLDGTALSVGAGTSNLIVNEIRLTSAQTSGTFCALNIRATVSAGGYANSSAGGGIIAYLRGEVSGTPASHVCGVHINFTITGGTPPEYCSALHVKLHESGATMTSAGRCHPLRLEINVADDVAANQLSWIFLEDNSTQKPDYFIDCSNFTSLPASAFTGTVAIGAATAYGIKVRLAGESTTTWYIPILNALA
jgi:hypothetical protein